MVVVGEPLFTNDALDVAATLMPYLRRIRDKANGIEPEELKRMLRDGEATLHPIGEEGYIIASWSPTQMFVISAAAFTLKCTNLTQHISAAIDYAKQHNCSTIAFRSSRKAWQKIGTEQGFTQEDSLFTKEI